MTEYSLKDHVSGDVTFSHYRNGNLFYITHLGLEFPVPVEDTDGASFQATEKGMMMMRWIRKVVK